MKLNIVEKQVLMQIYESKLEEYKNHNLPWFVLKSLEEFKCIKINHDLITITELGKVEIKKIAIAVLNEHLKHNSEYVNRELMVPAKRKKWKSI